MKRIVLATPLYPPEPGGPATHAKLLEEFLTKKGTEVCVVPFRRVRHFPTVIRHLLYAYYVFCEALNSDIVFAEDTMSSGLPALIAAKLARKPFVVRVPGDFAWEQGVQRFGVLDTIDAFQHTRYGLQVECLRFLMHAVVRHADRVIVPTEYFNRLVSGWVRDVARVETIYNGIDLTIVPKKPNARPEGLTVVSIGRLVPWKGFICLIRLLKTLPDWHLVIIGEGPDRMKLEEFAESCGVRERVVFTGALPRDEVLGWCAAADAFVLNSSFESFSYQVVEALSMGVPVIATRVGSIPELLESGVEGALFAPNNAEELRRLLTTVRDEPDVWKERTERGKKRSEAFGAERTAQQFDDLFNQLILSRGC